MVYLVKYFRLNHEAVFSNELVWIEEENCMQINKKLMH